MNYFGKKVLLTGASGFLGSHLFTELNKAGAEVTVFEGDVRDRETVWHHVRRDLDYVFHFGTPSSQVLFKRNPYYCAETTLTSFFHIAKACREHGVKLIYPSTGLISNKVLNEYSRCKKVCEDIHLGSGMDALGIRLFAAYGPGEGHKRDYASVPYLFARDMVQGKSPLIFGDGLQIRDFIYIDDAVRAIMILAEEAREPIVEVGSGISTSFNDLVLLINDLLGKKIEPIRTTCPDDYIKVTRCDVRVLHQYYRPKYKPFDGVRKIIKELK